MIHIQAFSSESKLDNPAIQNTLDLESARAVDTLNETYSELYSGLSFIDSNSFLRNTDDFQNTDNDEVTQWGIEMTDKDLSELEKRITMIDEKLTHIKKIGWI